MSSTPNHAAPAAAAPPAAGAEPSTSQLLKMLVGTLNRLVHPSIAPNILRSAAAEAGIDLKELVKEANQRGRPKKEQGDKPAKPAKVRAVQPYTIFVSKVMDRVKEDPQYHLPLGDNGKPVRNMVLAGLLWKQLSDGTREAFVKSYQPLCDTLTSQRVAGVKTEGLPSKIHAFEDAFDAATKNQFKALLPSNLSLALHPGAVLALPEGAVHEENEDSSDEESDDEEDEVAAAAAKREMEEKRLEAEKKAKEEEVKKKKKEEKDAKKKEKQLAAASKAPAAAAAAADGTEGKKSKKKHKSKDQGDQPDSAKKPKKA